MSKCQVCKGTKGGIQGNDNIVNGVIMCDYCHAETLKFGKRENGKLDGRPRTK